MKPMITLDTTHISLPDDLLRTTQERACAAEQKVRMGTGEGAAFLGWRDLPETYDRAAYARITELAARVREDADALVVIGIGGSYLGARAAIDVVRGPLGNTLAHTKGDMPEVYYAGINLSGDYLHDLLQALEDKSVYVNVISKSGTTLEPAVAFRIIREHLSTRYSSEELQKRIIVTTDRAHGALRAVALREGYETFVVPDDIGGRYSVLTAVGLVPLAIAGVDTAALLDGAHAMMTSVRDAQGEHDAVRYAAARNALYDAGKKVDIFVSSDPAWHYVGEWWKQLFGESEGKDGKGIFPVAMDFTSDLHSLGQYVQEGERHLFKTILTVAEEHAALVVPEEQHDDDGLNDLAGNSIDALNRAAHEGTVHAHADGSVPQLIITVPEKNAYYLGQLFYFFEYACAVSAYTLGVNPFDQPGVEAYKKNMFALLGKK